MNEAWSAYGRLYGKAQKYRNKRTTVDDISFDSKKEARRWGELQMLANALRCQADELRQHFLDIAAADPQRYLVLDAGERRTVLRAAVRERVVALLADRAPVQVLAPSRAPVQP